MYKVNFMAPAHLPKISCTIFIFLLFQLLNAQKLNFDVILFGNKIGHTIIERIVKNDSITQYKLNSSSEVTIFFTKKTSHMNFDVLYKNGKLFSAYVKNVKDGVTEIVNIMWQDTKYIIERGEERLQMLQPLDFSAILLYFTEPLNRTKIFSERMGEYANFVKTGTNQYECKTANGVNNIYRYKDGKLVELEMNKGASVFMRLAQ